MQTINADTLRSPPTFIMLVTSLWWCSVTSCLSVCECARTHIYIYRDLDTHKYTYICVCINVTLSSDDWKRWQSIFPKTSVLICPLSLSRRRHQQYECKWYIPLADLTFQTLDDSDSCPSVQVLPEHEIEEMKIKISLLKSEIQKEKVICLLSCLTERLTL